MHNTTSRQELDLLILGPVPPPFGGVSVHVSRLVPILEEIGLRVGVLNHFGSTEPDYVLGALKRNPLNYFRLPKRFSARVVHYHHSRWSTLVAVALGRRSSRARYMVTLHSPIISGLESKVPLVSRITKWALQGFDAIIVVTPTIKTAIEAHVDRRRIVVLPAFLEASFDGFEYEDPIERFFEAGSVLIVPAYRAQLFDGGQDMYGFDTAVEAFAKLAPERPDLRLAFFIAERTSRRREGNHLQGLQRQLEQLGLDDRVLFAFGLPLVPAFRHHVVMIRPTRSDGDALSVREALQAEIPVVASDVVQRPQGTLTFPAGDVGALCSTLRDILDWPVPEGDAGVASKAERNSFYEGVIRIYRSQLALEDEERSRSPAGR